MWGISLLTKPKATNTNTLKRRGHVHPNSVAAWQQKKLTVRPSQIAILKAMDRISVPCHYRMISQYMQTIEGSVTPRLRELLDKGLIKVAYVNVGFDRKRVNYYTLTGKGVKFIERYAD